MAKLSVGRPNVYPDNGDFRPLLAAIPRLLHLRELQHVSHVL